MRPRAVLLAAAFLLPTVPASAAGNEPGDAAAATAATAAAPPVPPVPPAAAAEQAGDWRAEFEAVCSQTDAALGLTDEELAQFIARCDRLAERLAGEPEVVRRVYLRKLGRCRDLLAYVLQSRAAGAPAPASPP